MTTLRTPNLGKLMLLKSLITTDASFVGVDPFGNIVNSIKNILVPV